MATIAKASQDYLVLCEFISNQSEGVVLEYSSVEDSTGIRMDPSGKSKLRRAIMSSNREYTVIRGTGYQLADPTIALGIVSERVRRIERQVKRGERAHRIIKDQFDDRLPASHRQAIDYIAQSTNAIRLCVENQKQVFKAKPVDHVASPSITIEVPRMT